MKLILVLSIALLSSCSYYAEDYSYLPNWATPTVSTVTVISRPAFITPVIAPYDDSIRLNYFY